MSQESLFQFMSWQKSVPTRFDASTAKLNSVSGMTLGSNTGFFYIPVVLKFIVFTC